MGFRVCVDSLPSLQWNDRRKTLPVRLLKQKISPRKHVQHSISPLLAAVAKRTSLSPAFRNKILLRCYIALDALSQNKASRELFVLLGQFVLISQALTAMGYSSEARPQLTLARTALIQVGERAVASGVWGFLEPEYLLLCECVTRFAYQLEFASYEHMAKAEMDMLAYLEMPAEPA